MTGKDVQVFTGHFIAYALAGAAGVGALALFLLALKALARVVQG